LPADGDLYSEKVCGEKNNILYWADHRAAKAKQKNLLYWHDEPNELTKEGSLSYVLQESPFASVLTVSRGQHSQRWQIDVKYM
jgi:hypothetical protein